LTGGSPGFFACPRGCRWWSDFRADGSLRERSSRVGPGGHPRICPSRGRFEGTVRADRMRWLALQGWYPSAGRPGIGVVRRSRRMVLRLFSATGLWTGFDLVPQKSLLPGAGRAGCPLRQNGCYPVDPPLGNQGGQRPQAHGPSSFPLGGTVFCFESPAPSSCPMSPGFDRFLLPFNVSSQREGAQAGVGGLAGGPWLVR
jgi:hypothetical protein